MPESTDLEARARAALTEIATLRKDVARQGLEIYRGWRSRIARSTFAPSALNFAHYLALRRHDLRPLQRKLMALGISSLGRLESRVLVSLDAVTRRARRPGAAQDRRRPARRRSASSSAARLALPPTPRRFSGRRTRAAPAASWSRSPPKPPTTRRSSAGSPRRGADVVRINCAHDGPREWERMVANVRAAERQIGRRLPVLMDIGGPKVRTGRVLTPPDRSRLHIGDVVLLARDIVPAAHRRAVPGDLHAARDSRSHQGRRRGVARRRPAPAARSSARRTAASSCASNGASSPG